jgi:3'-5' exonuclease
VTVRNRIREIIVRWLRNAPPSGAFVPRALFDRPIAAFDIETIPDPDLGRRLQGIEGSDAEVVREMVKRRQAESDGKKEYPHLPLHRIVSCCVTTIDPETARVSIRDLGNESDWRDERSRVEGFFRFGSGAGVPRAPRLVSWNGNGFDLPVLRYRAMILGIAAPDYYRAHEEAASADDSEMHIDLMDMLSDQGASARVGLNTLASVVGLPGKKFLERPVYDHVLDGEATRVIEYCKLDTAMTLLLFLLWAFHTGHISKNDVRRYVESIRSSIAKLTFVGWRDIEPLLANWPNAIYAR